MKPGRELDALVAEHVMGLDPKHFMREQTYHEIMEGGQALKHYSTDTAAAMEIMPTWPWTLERSDNFNKATIGYKGEVYTATGDSIAHAICLAALKAVGYDL